MRLISLVAIIFIVASLPLLLLLILKKNVDGEGDLNPGFWGEKTANVNWCEEDYVVTKYIAEFGNSLSSLAIVLNGLYGIWSHWQWAELRYIIAFSQFCVVGIGSFLFHATLKREFQLLDELPMIWANGMFTYIIICMEDEYLSDPSMSTKKQSRKILVWVIVFVEIIMTLLVILFDTKDQSFFLLFYGGGVTYVCFQSLQLNKKYNSKGKFNLFEMSIAFYVGGFFLWGIDRNFCKTSISGLTIRSLHLHSFWHLAAGIGTFSAVLYWIHTRNLFLKRKQTIKGNPMNPAGRWIALCEKVV